jgi:hypothetical protein
MLFQHDDAMRWLSFIPAKLPLQVVGHADSLKWINDNMDYESSGAMLKFIGEAIKPETTNGYRCLATSSSFVPKRQTEADAVMARIGARLKSAVAKSGPPR